MSAHHRQAAEVNLGILGWLNRLMLWLIALAVVGLIILKYLPAIQKTAFQRQRVEELRAAVIKTRAAVQAQDQRVAALKTDPRTVERETREQMGYGAPGETIVTFQ
jgi:cell division protein FtsB